MKAVESLDGSSILPGAAAVVAQGPQYPALLSGMDKGDLTVQLIHVIQQLNVVLNFKKVNFVSKIRKFRFLF